jgi:hypothetical protein
LYFNYLCLLVLNFELFWIFYLIFKTQQERAILFSLTMPFSCDLPSIKKQNWNCFLLLLLIKRNKKIKFLFFFNLCSTKIKIGTIFLESPNRNKKKKSYKLHWTKKIWNYSFHFSKLQETKDKIRISPPTFPNCKKQKKNPTTFSQQNK